MAHTQFFLALDLKKGNTYRIKKRPNTRVYD